MHTDANRGLTKDVHFLRDREILGDALEGLPSKGANSWHDREMAGNQSFGQPSICHLGREVTPQQDVGALHRKGIQCVDTTEPIRFDPIQFALIQSGLSKSNPISLKPASSNPTSILSDRFKQLARQLCGFHA